MLRLTLRFLRGDASNFPRIAIARRYAASVPAVAQQLQALASRSATPTAELETRIRAWRAQPPQTTREKRDGRREK